MDLSTWIGRVIYGYCNGAFDVYWGEWLIEAAGEDWIVARNTETQEPEFVSFYGWAEVEGFLKAWARGGGIDDGLDP